MFWPVTESRLAVGSSASTILRPGHQRARHGHALALAAGELVGPVLGVLVEAHLLEQLVDALPCARPCASLRCSSSGNSTFWKTLSTETRLKLWKMKPMVCSRRSVSCRSRELLGVLARRRSTTPEVAVSTQPIRLSSVVLPLPEARRWR